MANWYYSVGGAQHGPVEDDEMSAMLASGMINSATLVWKDGMETWQRLDRHPEGMELVKSTMGAPIPGRSMVAPTNGLAIASMVCGLLSLPLVTTCMLGMLTAIPAVICGHLSLNQIKKAPFQGGRGLAITGLITGYLAILLTLVLILVFGVAISQELS